MEEELKEIIVHDSNCTNCEYCKPVRKSTKSIGSNIFGKPVKRTGTVKISAAYGKNIFGTGKSSKDSGKIRKIKRSAKKKSKSKRKYKRKSKRKSVKKSKCKSM